MGVSTRTQMPTHAQMHITSNNFPHGKTSSQLLFKVRERTESNKTSVDFPHTLLINIYWYLKLSEHSSF